MKTKEIKVSYKVAIKKYDTTIYSYGFEKTVEIEKNDNEILVKEKLWDEAVSEIEKQINLT